MSATGFACRKVVSFPANRPAETGARTSPEVALKGDGAEQFGIRPLLDPVLAEHPSRLATMERQLLLIDGRPGVRIVDTTLEEIGGMLGVTRERVRQLRDRALKRLREGDVGKALASFAA